jgi:hypothetical protein
MTITVKGLNQFVYENKTAHSIDATIAVSGSVRLDLNVTGQAATSQQFPAQGGVVSLTVPAGAKIDGNTMPSTATVSIEFVHFK